MLIMRGTEDRRTTRVCVLVVPECMIAQRHAHRKPRPTRIRRLDSPPFNPFWRILLVLYCLSKRFPFILCTQETTEILYCTDERRGLGSGRWLGDRSHSSSSSIIAHAFRSMYILDGGNHTENARTAISLVFHRGPTLMGPCRWLLGTVQRCYDASMLHSRRFHLKLV